MKKYIILLALTAILAINAFADIRLPDTPKPTPAPKQAKAIDAMLAIRIDKDATEARLIVPKSQLKQLRAELEQMDDSDSTAAFNFTRTQTIVSGLFLSLAFVFGGVWFSRSRKVSTKTGKTFAVGAVLLLFGAFATIAFANIGPPPDARSITGKIFTPAVHQYKQAWGKIKLEISDKDETIQLIVPDAPDEEKKAE